MLLQFDLNYIILVALCFLISLAFTWRFGASSNKGNIYNIHKLSHSCKRNPSTYTYSPSSAFDHRKHLFRCYNPNMWYEFHRVFFFRAAFVTPNFRTVFIFLSLYKPVKMKTICRDVYVFLSCNYPLH